MRMDQVDGDHDEAVRIARVLRDSFWTFHFEAVVGTGRRILQSVGTRSRIVQTSTLRRERDGISPPTLDEVTYIKRSAARGTGNTESVRYRSRAVDERQIASSLIQTEYPKGTE